MKRPRSQETDEKGFHGELCSSDRSGQLDITPGVIKAHNLSENTRVEQTHDGSPDERNSSSAHTVKEQFVLEENRDIALFNTDNEFNRAINEEEHRLQHSKTTTFCSETRAPAFETLIQKIENNPNRHALQRDLQQRRLFNPFNKNHKT